MPVNLTLMRRSWRADSLNVLLFYLSLVTLWQRASDWPLLCIEDVPSVHPIRLMEGSDRASFELYCAMFFSMSKTKHRVEEKGCAEN